MSDGWTHARVGESVETPFFFGSPGRRKFAVLHAPSAAAPAGVPIVVCHPAFEEKLWAHRVLVDLARRAAARGHSVLRFDLSGQGDSEGAFEDFGFSEHEQDVTEAWRLLGERAGSAPLLLGLRFGGTLAGRAAAGLGARAVLWEPVLDPSEWMMEVLRANLTFQLKRDGKVRRDRQDLIRGLEAGETVRVEGYGITPRFYREAVASRGLLGADFPGGCPAVLVAIIRKRPGASPLDAVASEWARNVPTELLRVAEEPFWTDVRRYRTQASGLTDRTLAWIEAGGTP